MPAPSPAAIIENPPPLNATAFPYAVEEFPVAALALQALAIPVASAAPGPQMTENPHRLE